ncbi:hypothetical protein FG386_001014 [Cryptosporidium ryanae]|uniref:uncharacterized protein n=1 Tax=Cryptosporidium ryanae TaxID=515981 RepID=UPI00351A2149|nr:hypothetical protein FG386_001014 [Cryptosporidium ryanae]
MSVGKTESMPKPDSLSKSESEKTLGDRLESKSDTVTNREAGEHRAEEEVGEDDSNREKVLFLDAFSALSLNSKKNLFEFIEDDNLLELRITCKKLNNYCNGYIRYCLKNCYFFNVPLTRLTIDFWFTVTRFFFLEAGKVFPLNRVHYNPIVAALKHNHKILPVSMDQMKSHVLISLDKLLPEHIVFCNHFHPQPHTCDVNLEIKGQSKVFFDEINILKFVKHYFDHLDVTDDELIRGNRQLTRHRLALYLYELLKLIKMLSEKGNGVFKLSRIEYIVNTGTLLRHRIWHQLHASWGSSKKQNDLENKKNEDKQKEPKSSGQPNNENGGSRHRRLSDNYNGSIIKSNVKNANDSSALKKKNTDELVVEIHLTIADHFQWDS